jgi:hypothetical protein
VEYIAATLDDALKTLPEPQRVHTATEAGRVDKLVALTLKAELLLFAASDLFNGNTEMASMVDNRNIQLFPKNKEQKKWRIAADACGAANAACHAAGKELYDQEHVAARDADPVFKLQTVIRQTIGDQWNKELIWGDTEYNREQLSAAAGTRLIKLNPWGVGEVNGEWSPTIKMVEQYYSSNGVPIQYDKEWVEKGWYDNRYKIRPEPSLGDEKYYVAEKDTTVYLHFNREPRFYACIAFDRGIYFGTSWYTFEDMGSAKKNVKIAKFRKADDGHAGVIAGEAHTITGYGVKKMYSLTAVQSENSTSPGDYFPFPIFRLADLYLMYAEALNEAEGPVDSVFYFIDKIRNRAGLHDLKYCWDTYTRLPKYYNDQNNMREIIRQERAIELAFEGKRFWDLRRWRKISEFNTTPMGWNVFGENKEDFYTLTNVATKPSNLTIKDYFWPIRESNLYVNKNLKQNYGW